MSRKKSEEKIFLGSEEGLGTVLIKLSKSEAKKIVLNVPPNSVLRSSADNFHALKREADLTKKEIVIESIDPYIEELAEASKLESINPVFGKKENFVADIIPPSGSGETKVGRWDKQKKKEKSYDFIKSYREKMVEENPRKPFFCFPLPNLKIKTWWTVLLLVVLVVGGWFLAAKVLPRARMNIVLKKIPVSFEEVSVKASVNAFNVETDGDLIVPGEVISSTKNMEMKFLSSGKDRVERRATGEVYIFNEYSSVPQVLVATTRLLTPDGKIYRLNDRVIVPGAQVVGGKLSPSKIKVKVTAYKAGEDYNINPDLNEKWTIPGFKEAGLMDRYRGFYAKPAGPMEGGFVGIRSIPTDEDITKAKEEIRKNLEKTLSSQIIMVNSPEFKILEGASEFRMVEEKINELADEEGKFSVFAAAEMKNFVFKKDDLIKALVKRFLPEIDFELKVLSEKIDYKDIAVDWDKGVMNFVVSGSLIFESKLDADNLKSRFLGKNEVEMRSIILGIPGLEKANISLWPFWVKSVPNNPKKVEITLE